MSARILVALDVLPVRVERGHDQCSNRCPQKGSTRLDSLAAGPEVCLIFGVLQRKPRTHQTYLRAEACVAAERRALDLKKGETGEF